MGRTRTSYITPRVYLSLLATKPATIILHTQTCFTLQRKHPTVQYICAAKEKCIFFEKSVFSERIIQKKDA